MCKIMSLMFNFYNLALIYHLCVTSFPSLHNVRMEPLLVKMSITKTNTCLTFLFILPFTFLVYSFLRERKFTWFRT